MVIDCKYIPNIATFYLVIVVYDALTIGYYQTLVVRKCLCKNCVQYNTYVGINGLLTLRSVYMYMHQFNYKTSCIKQSLIYCNKTIDKLSYSYICIYMYICRVHSDQS